MSDHGQTYQNSPPGQWGTTPHVYPHSHHGTPAQEYASFGFQANQTFGGSIQQRPIQQQLQPLVMPQWPSMLNSPPQQSQPHMTYQPQYAPSAPPVQSVVQPIQPMPVMDPGQTSASSASSRPATLPRRTLTDSDRRKMCKFAEDNPQAKQTEIGALFGVERSTVSKVLRQKDKYLLQDEGSRSPMARATRRRSPDIERALAVWAKNQQKKGLPLSDDSIREKARAFAATTPAENQPPLSSSWIEKFKLRNNLVGARSRKGSTASEDADNMSTTESLTHTPVGTSPVDAVVVGSPSPIELPSGPSRESLKTDSPDSFADFSRRNAPFHSESRNSLSSAFTDTAPSSFSPGPFSPTSPLFTPESGTAASPFPRSIQRLNTVTPSETMRPPPLPAHVLAGELKREGSDTSVTRLSPQGTTSPEEAQKALQVVMSFFEQQPQNLLDFSESMMIGRLMEKLRLHTRASSSS